MWPFYTNLWTKYSEIAFILYLTTWPPERQYGVQAASIHNTKNAHMAFSLASQDGFWTTKTTPCWIFYLAEFTPGIYNLNKINTLVLALKKKKNHYFKCPKYILREGLVCLYIQFKCSFEILTAIEAQNSPKHSLLEI